MDFESLKREYESSFSPRCRGRNAKEGISRGCTICSFRWGERLGRPPRSSVAVSEIGELQSLVGLERKGGFLVFFQEKDERCMHWPNPEISHCQCFFLTLLHGDLMIRRSFTNFLPGISRFKEPLSLLGARKQGNVRREIRKYRFEYDQKESGSLKREIQRSQLRAVAYWEVAAGIPFNLWLIKRNWQSLSLHFLLHLHS